VHLKLLSSLVVQGRRDDVVVVVVVCLFIYLYFHCRVWRPTDWQACSVARRLVIVALHALKPSIEE